MEQKKQPVEQYYYSESEWNRLGCGALPAERDRHQTLQDDRAKGNPQIDDKALKGYN
jgi:hypothetical protein